MDVSAAGQRLRYQNEGPEEAEEALGGCERTFWLKSTLDSNINLSGNVHFVVPPDPVAFTDVNATYLSVSFQVFRWDGSRLSDVDKVFLSPNSLASIFRSVQVSLNGAPLDPSNAYNWSSTLTSYLGMAKSAREDVWERLAGMRLPGFNSSQLLASDVGYFVDPIKQVAGSNVVTLTGRLMSDFTQSCAQLLPPGIKIEVNLARNPDSVPLCACNEDTSVRYKLQINSASLFLRRVKMSEAVLGRTLRSIAEGAYISYTRMGVIVNQIPASGVSFRAGNIFGGGTLPHTLYIVLANQQAYSGSLRHLANFLESGFLRSLQLFENGRPVLAQPMRMHYVYTEDGYTIDTHQSDATEPFLSVTQALDGIANTQIAASLSYDEFLAGCVVYCVQLNSCGGRRMGPGFVDVELELEEDVHRAPMNLLCFGEFDKTLHFDANLQLLPN